MRTKQGRRERGQAGPAGALINGVADMRRPPLSGAQIGWCRTANDPRATSSICDAQAKTSQMLPSWHEDNREAGP